MPRNIPAPVLAAYQEERVNALDLAVLDFPGVPVLAHNGLGSIWFDWDGDGSDEEFLGVGDLGEISQIREGAGLEADGMTFRLTGVDSALISEVLAQHYQGRTAQVYEQLFDDAGAAIGDPTLWWEGRMDVPEIIDDFEKGTSEIIVTAESIFVTWARSRTRLRTDADQQARYPGDTGLSRLTKLNDLEIQWGV